jgi:hypothetical protein
MTVVNIAPANIGNLGITEYLLHETLAYLLLPANNLL